MRDSGTLVVCVLGAVASGFYLRRALAKSPKLPILRADEPEAAGVELLQILRRILALVLVFLIGWTGYVLWEANLPWVWYDNLGEGVKSDRRRWFHESELAEWVWIRGFFAVICGLVLSIWSWRRNGFLSSVIDWIVAVYLFVLTANMFWFSIGRGLMIT